MPTENKLHLVRLNLLCTDCPGEHCTLSAVLITPNDGNPYPGYCPYSGSGQTATWREYRPEEIEA